MRWMDLLRGSAMALVLFWHAPAVPVLFGYEMPSWLRSANDFFLPFRMPMLMFLSGLLLERALQKPMKQYYLGKLSLLVWPYLVWTAILIGLYGDELSYLSPRSWIATGYLWFLFFIATYYIAAPITKWIPDWALAASSLALSLLPEGNLTKSFFYFAGFFFAGQFISRHKFLISYFSSGLPLMLAAILGIGFGIASAIFGGERFEYDARFALLSVAGIVSSIAGAVFLLRFQAWKAIEFIGRNSLIFYTSHFPVMLITVYGAIALGVDSIIYVALGCLLLASLAGYGLAKYQLISPFKWLFVFPMYKNPRRLSETRDRSKNMLE